MSYLSDAGHWDFYFLPPLHQRYRERLLSIYVVIVVVRRIKWDHFLETTRFCFSTDMAFHRGHVKHPSQYVFFAITKDSSILPMILSRVWVQLLATTAICQPE